MTDLPNAVDAKGGQMAIRKKCAPAARIELNPNTTSQLESVAPAGWSSKRGRLARLIAIGCLGTLITTSVGCTTLSNSGQALCDTEFIDDFMVNHRNSVMASRAWYRERAHFKDHCHQREVKKGFMDGYNDVAGGGTGCIPAVAPRDYWGWRYQTADGNAAVNSWFEGYPL